MSQTAPDDEGWTGPVEHGGQTSTCGLRLEETTGDSVTIRISMPAVGALDAPRGTGTVDGYTLRIGPWSVVYDEARTSSGIGPGVALQRDEGGKTRRHGWFQDHGEGGGGD